MRATPDGRIREFSEKPKGEALKAMQVDTEQPRPGAGGSQESGLTWPRWESMFSAETPFLIC